MSDEHGKPYYGKLDPEVKKLWLKELRSGKHRQVTNFLTKREKKTGKLSHCCLGVCRRYVLPKINNPSVLDQLLKPKLHSAGNNERYFEYEYNGGKIIPDIAAEIGLTPPAQARLVHMNDSGSSFEEIADWIEKNL